MPPTGRYPTRELKRRRNLWGRGRQPIFRMSLAWVQKMPTGNDVKSRGTASSVVTLMPEQTIGDVTGLHTKLLDGLNRCARVRLVAADVVHIDTATLQLLCAFVLEGRQRGVAVEWETPSEAFTMAARLLGLDEVLALE